MGVVPPEPGFNQFLAETCAAHGALFVSDEVMTGFRAVAQGRWGLDGAVEGWTPDLMTFGKVMGGGFPAAAFGGRADVMRSCRPEGPVYQAGTLSGNPIATTAGLATLRLAHRRGLRPPHRRSVRRSRPRRGGAVRRRRAPSPCSPPAPCSRSSSPRARSATTTAAQRQDTAAVRRLLPRDARPRRLPAAVGVRGLVRLGRARRACRAAVLDALPAAARAAAAAAATARKEPMADTTVVHLLRHGEVHNPERRPLRTARRLPPLRARPGDGPARRRHGRRARHRPPAHLPAGARPGDGRPARRGARPRARSSTRG